MTAGLSLIELLVVVAILAALAGLGWTAYQGVYAEQQAQLGRVQLQQLAQAMRQFHADTGHWPGQGPFALASATNVESPSGPRHIECSDLSAGLWVRSTLPAVHVPGGVSDVEAWTAAWFAHPANLWALVTRPTLCANHVLGRLQDWQPGAARGWRGPYVQPEQLGWVEVGAGLAADGSGDASALPLQSDLNGLAAGLELPPVAAGHGPCASAADDCAYRWLSQRRDSTGFDVLRHAVPRRGRPLLYFPAGRPRLAWAGPDGRFGGLHAAASAQACEPDLAATGGADDLVICLE